MICCSDWAEDSTVFHLGESAVKVYKDHISEQNLVDYHHHHNSFAGEEFGINVGKELEFWNDSYYNQGYVSCFLVRVLQMPDDSIRRYNSRLVTKVPYVDGTNALELEAMYPKYFRILARILEDKLGTNHVSPLNIKASNIEDEIVKLTVTDLGNSIHNLLKGIN